jgi:Ca2+-binding RTX toxin-like protein
MTFLITRIGPQTVVSERGILSASCTVLPLSDGYINVWAELINGALVVYQQRFEADGNASSSRTVVQSETLEVEGYNVTLLANGDYVSTWTYYNRQDSSAKIYQRIFDITGKPKTSDILVDVIPDYYFNSQIIITPFSDGKYSISWQWDNLWDGDIHDEIYHRVVDVDGSTIKTDIFDGRIFFKPGVLALAGDGYVVAWLSREQTPNSSGNPIYLRIHDAAGNAVGEDLVVDPNALFDPKLTITALADGKYALTWLSDRNLDGAQEIYQRLFTADGKPVGAEILVKDTTSAIQGSPEITALHDGGYVVVWERYFGGGGGIFKRQYDADGFATEPETLISPSGDSDAGSPTVTSLANGKYIVTWESGYEAYSQLFDTSGKRIGDAILINDRRLNFIDSVTSTALPDGSHVVTWEAGGDIYQRFFNSKALPALTTGRERALGTDGDDLLSIVPQTLTAGDILEALGGIDTLQLESAGILNLRAAANVSGFEFLKGSIGDDVIATNISRLESFSTLDLGPGVDVLQVLIEGSCDLRALPQLIGIEELQVQGSDADDSVLVDTRFGSRLAIDLGAGTDRLTLGVAGTYNLEGTRNVEEVRGTIRDDVVVVDWNVLTSGIAIDLGLGSDALELTGGGTFALSQYLLEGVEKIVVSNGYRTKVIATNRPDVVIGGSGQDDIIGRIGKDHLSGGDGNDRVDGGSENDRLAGGEAKDVFVFTSRLGRSNIDTITDFNVKDDTIWLDNAVFRKVGKGTSTKPAKLKSDAFVIGKEARDGEDRIIYDKAGGGLYYDPDGTGSVGAIKFVQVKKGLTLKSTDFFVI